MREIKFRAWNGNEMFYPETENNSDTFWSGFNSGKVEIRDYTTEIADNLCIPLQYTGLKDKNGKEVYDGDIVEFRCDGCIQSEVGKIKRSVIVFENGSFDIKDWSINETKWIEIVGNIYENPELLNQ